MTNTPYLNKEEMEQAFCVGGGLEAISYVLDRTEIPTMKENLQKAHEYLEKVRDERWSYLVDEYAREKAYKRIAHAQVKMCQKGVDFSETPSTITLDEDQVMDMAEIISELKCYGCTSDKRECKIYQLFRKMSLPAVFTNCDKVKCEYRVEKK